MVDRTRLKGIDRHGPNIRIRITHKGRRYTENFPGNYDSPRDLSAAVRRRDELKSRLILGLPLDDAELGNNNLFLADCQRYMDGMTDIDHSTAIDYENILNKHWMPAFHNLITKEITTQQIKRVLAETGLSQKRKRNLLIPLRGVFDTAEVNPNPVAPIRLKRPPKRKVARFRPAETAALINELDRMGDAQVAGYFALLLGCGLRPGGEPLGLQWPDYDGERIHIHRTIVRRRIKETTKTHEDRTVYVPRWVRPYLDALPSRFGGGWLFLNSHGGPYLDADHFNAAWREIFTKKAIKHDLRMEYRIPYVCRHTRAAELLSTGVDPSRAAKQLGHSVEMFFRTYSEWIDEYQRNNDDELEGVTNASSRNKSCP